MLATDTPIKAQLFIGVPRVFSQSDIFKEDLLCSPPTIYLYSWILLP